MVMITEIEDYFTKGCGRCKRFATPDCSTRLWLDGLEALRRICLDVGLSETVKWGHPCYMHAGRNIVVMGAFRDGFRLSFFNAALMKDPEEVLDRQGPNTQHADALKFSSVERVLELEPVIRAYLGEAMRYAEDGIRAPKVETDLELPDELVEALDADSELAEAFHGLTPGRQKGWVLHFSGAKKSETRVARIGKAVPQILDGKGMHDR